MSYMFSGCSSLTELNLTSFDTQIVTNMNSMFSSCSSIHYLDLSSFNTEKCKTFTNMFDKTKDVTVKVNSAIASKLIDAIKDIVHFEYL